LWPYLVMYRLAKPQYARAMADLLVDMGASRLADGAWLIVSDWNARAILEQLRPFLTNNDSLHVLEIGEDCASTAPDISGLIDLGQPGTTTHLQVTRRRRRCMSPPKGIDNTLGHVGRKPEI
jgi:hypothetical protein